MRFWIQSFGMTLGAVKIYRMWLVAGGSLDVVRDDVLRWLATFGRTKVSQYVYSAWLQAGGKYEVIGDACERWFERNAESSDAVFLLKYIIRNEYLREPVVRAAIRWCARFAQLPDTIWRVCSLMGRHGNGPYALAITRSLIVTIRLLDLGRLRLKSTSAQRVEEEEDGSLLAFLLCGALGKALRVSSLDAFDIADLREIHVSLVANTDLYSLVTERGAIPYEGVIVTHVVSLIRSEDLDPARDFAPLQRFAQALVRSSGRDGAGFLQLVSLVPSLGDVGQPAP